MRRRRQPRRHNGLVAALLGPKSQVVGLAIAVVGMFGRGEIRDVAADRKTAELALDASQRIHQIEEHGSEQARENRALIDSLFREIARMKRSVSRDSVRATSAVERAKQVERRLEKPGVLQRAWGWLFRAPKGDRT